MDCWTLIVSVFLACLFVDVVLYISTVNDMRDLRERMTRLERGGLNE